MDALSEEALMSSYGMPKQRILVAGGAGFLGTRLCEVLLDQGHEVICVDNFITGRHENTERFMNNSRYSVLHHDIINPISLDVNPTQIYNLACAASPPHYQADPIHTLRTCVEGSLNLLELGKRSGARVLLASTSEVYGDPQVHPQSESYRGNVNSVGVRSCYDEGKRCAETLFSDYGRQKQVVIKIARIFNTYGPGMSETDGRVVSNFICQALRGEDLTVYGDGSQTRSLCYVDDMIDGLMRLMNSPESFKGPVNLGNPQEVTVLQLAELVRQLTKADAGVEFKPLPADDPTRRCPDIQLAHRHLAWQPTTHLTTGLLRTIAYFRELLQASSQEAASRPTDIHNDIARSL